MVADVEMNKPRTAAPEDSSSSRQPSRMTLIWHGLLLAWFVVLCLVPDPRPLGASELAVKGVRLLVGFSDFIKGGRVPYKAVVDEIYSEINKKYGSNIPAPK